MGFKITCHQKIGTNFKKENVFLATLVESKVSTKETLKGAFGAMASKKEKDFLSVLVENGALSSEEYDLFYKDEKGYTRFVDGKPETIAGDNSDGKGVIKNIVPFWEYYSEEQIEEVVADGKYKVICVTDIAPLQKYTEDYNKA